jgi:acyl-CoA synthetase (AMP-forming)/AMP-acid ligase II
LTGSCWRRFLEVAGQRRDAPALVAGALTTSFAELRERALRWASREEMAGVSPGDRVVIWSGNSAAMAAAVLAVWARGAIPVLLGEQTARRHLLHAVELTGAAVLAADPALVERAVAVGRPVVALDNRGPAGKFEASPAAADQPASIVFTSGSTGLPKGVVQTHGTLQAANAAVYRSIGLRSDDRLLCGVPWSFDYGWGQLLFTLLSGVTQVLPAALDPLAVCEAIARHRPTVLAAVPALMAGLTQGVSGVRHTDVSSVRLVTTTGSRVPPEVLRDTVSAFPAAAMSLNYGLTETYRTTSLDPALALAHPSSVGRALPGVSIALVDDAGRRVSPGEVGEVVHRGVGVFQGYWADGEATERLRRPDPLWLGEGSPPPAVFTGDLGYLDGEGLLHLVGRRDRQTKSMGVRVSPEEIEAILVDSGLVREAAVLSRPHETIGDLVVAVVVPRGQSNDPTADLKRYARREMSPFMQPRHYELADALPRTTSGKVDYCDLARRLGAGGA